MNENFHSFWFDPTGKQIQFYCFSCRCSIHLTIDRSNNIYVTYYLGERKQDDLCEAMVVDVEHPGLIYLAQAREAFVQWKSSRNSGLTQETFAACIQSMGAIPELALYLI